MDAVIQLLLGLLQQLLPSLGVANAGLISKIVEGLVALIPVLIKEYKDVLPMVQNVISALKANAAITPEQIIKLQTIEAQIDADFETAATNALADDERADAEAANIAKP